MQNNIHHPAGISYSKSEQIINECNRLDSLLNHVIKGYESLESKFTLKALDDKLASDMRAFDKRRQSKPDGFFKSAAQAERLLKARESASRLAYSGFSLFAGQSVAEVLSDDPPYNNMGGGYVGGEEAEAEKQEAAQKAIKYAWIKDRVSQHKDVEQVTKVDAITITKPGVGFEKTLNELIGLLQESGIQIEHQGRGYKYGYKNYCQLVVTDDRRDTVAGVLCYATLEKPDMGLMLSLKGFGCEYLRTAGFWHDLYELGLVHDCKITLIDLALDLPGEYCKEHGITVPRLAMQEGLFKHEKATKSAWCDLVGAGTSFLSRELSAETYNPEEHCLNGMTFYSGAKTSSNRFRTYEKGKELLGKVPVDDFEAVKAETDLSWVRVERTVNPQDKQSARISFDDMLFTDRAFFTGYDGLYNILVDYCALADTDYRERWNAELKQREKDLGLIHVTTWLRNAYGKHINRFSALGLTPNQIVDLLTMGKVWEGDKDPYPDAKANPQILLRIWDAGAMGGAL